MNRLKQNYSGPADDIEIKNNYPNLNMALELQGDFDANILLSRDRFQRLLKNLQQMAKNNELRQQGYEIVYQEPSANRGYSQN